MKITKYILLSTTVLGLVNPLVVLADTNNSPISISSDINTKKNKVSASSIDIPSNIEDGTFINSEKTVVRINWPSTKTNAGDVYGGFAHNWNMNLDLVSLYDENINMISETLYTSDIGEEIFTWLKGKVDDQPINGVVIIKNSTGNLDAYYPINYNGKEYYLSGGEIFPTDNAGGYQRIGLRSEASIINGNYGMNGDSVGITVNSTAKINLNPIRELFKENVYSAFDENGHLVDGVKYVYDTNNVKNDENIASTGNDDPEASNVPHYNAIVYFKDVRESAEVTVKYVDENGKNIEAPSYISGNVGDDYTTEQKAFDGYTFHDVKGETSGKLDSQPKTVTYTYYKDDGSNHTVNFYDMNGKKIADEIRIDGRFEDNYDLTEQVNTILKDLQKQGYKQVSNYGSIKGKFIQVHDGAGYILTKLPENAVGTVKVNYVDGQGQSISDSKILGGKLGSDYQTEKKIIKGYTFKEVKGNETGKITNKEQTVTYVYTKNPEKAADVTVKYVDENGKKIAKSEVKSGNIGDKYTTEKKDIAGYTFKEVQGSTNGQFTDKAQTVTYIYTKNPEKGADVTVKYVDENGKKIAKSEVKSGNVGDKYTTEKKEITGYTFKEVQGSTNGQFTDKAQTVTYIYTKNPEKGADVTVKYVDENGKSIAKSEVKSGNVGDKYMTEKKDITGYTFKEVKGSANGEFTDKAQIVTYIYTKNDDNVKPSNPSQPAKPDTPDHSGDNNSNTSEQPGNNSIGNDVMNNVVEGVQSGLPKTAAKKMILAGIVSAVLVSLAGLVIWNKRK